jgi:hypothetical protein
LWGTTVTAFTMFRKSRRGELGSSVQRRLLITIATAFDLFVTSTSAAEPKD